jgi:hypothetical protein
MYLARALLNQNQKETTNPKPLLAKGLTASKIQRNQSHKRIFSADSRIVSKENNS